MLTRALKDDCWDVIMAGFNILNQSARERVLVQTRAKNIGVLWMFAVRRALHSPEVLQEVMRDLTAQGAVDANAYNADAPLDFLLTDGSATSLPDAAYRFCRDEPGIHVVLSGTESGASSGKRGVSGPFLPPQHIERLHRLFQRVDSVSGIRTSVTRNSIEL